MEWSKDAFKSLRGALIRLYRYPNDAFTFVDNAGLDSSRITFDNQALNNWHNILKYAESRGKLDKVLEQALKDEPEDEILLKIKEGNPLILIEGGKVNNWNGTGSRSKLEKIIGSRSTLVDVSYLEQGLICSKAVVRIRLSNSLGSGFLIKDNMLITNHHVIPNKEIAEKAVIQFNYQKTKKGTDAIVEEYGLVVETFKTSEEHDWTIIKVDGEPEKKWGILPISTREPQEGEYVNIIQHPGGAQKQVALSASVIVSVNENVVQYLTDTLPGSSGSPVFDSEWNVIALHHSGGWVTEPNVESKTTYLRNEGININRVIEGLR